MVKMILEILLMQPIEMVFYSSWHKEHLWKHFSLAVSHFQLKDKFSSKKRTLNYMESLPISSQSYLLIWLQIFSSLLFSLQLVIRIHFKGKNIIKIKPFSYRFISLLDGGLERQLRCILVFRSYYDIPLIRWHRRWLLWRLPI